MNLLKIPTAYAMSGHVATIAFINEPTAGAYGEAPARVAEDFPTQG
jgi:hypothetical protein